MRITALMRELRERLIDPEVVIHYQDPRSGEVPALTVTVAEACELFVAQDWAALADLYKKAGEEAWRGRASAMALRLHIAEWHVAERMSDPVRQADVAAFAAERHRLRQGFVAAEAWNRIVLSVPVTEATARHHARCWRGLSVVREVSAEYAEALEFCDRAVEICQRFPDGPETVDAWIKALMQKSAVQRLRGRPDLGLRDLREARRIAQTVSPDPLVQGLIELREGNLRLAIGDVDVALPAFRAAQEWFAGVSEHNQDFALLRELTCLRGLNRLAEALELADRLKERFAAAGDHFRLGQLLLERAEVLQDMGDFEQVATTLADAGSLLKPDSLEWLRWRRHMARNAINLGRGYAEAAEHLGTVLEVAARPERRDLTRVMLTLFDLTRLPEPDGPDRAARLAAMRAALVAADFQRDNLDQAQSRWSMHGQREEVYAAAMLLTAEAGDAAAAAQIVEAGRADVLNHLLTTGTAVPPGALGDLPVVVPPPAEEVAEEVFSVARRLAAAAGSGSASADSGVDSPVPLLSIPGSLPPEAELDQFADVVVLIQAVWDGDRWQSGVVSRRRGGSWRATLQEASPRVAALLDSLAGGRWLSTRGIGYATWDALTDFLLPHAEIWDGDTERPLSVLICPDPRLWQIPYPALTRNGQRLIDTAEVAVTPSLRTQALLHERARTRLAAVPSGSSGVVVSLLDPSLACHAVETDALEMWPGGHRPLDSLADLLLSDPVGLLLYISGHGEEPREEWMMNKGRVTLANLAAAVLPRLLLMNGCWSGTAATGYGRDPFSLAVGGLLGGADAVVAGVGRIGEQASARVAAETLALVGRGMPVQSALRAAQIRISAVHAGLGPFDWAGLRLVGMGTAQVLGSDGSGSP